MEYDSSHVNYRKRQAVLKLVGSNPLQVNFLLELPNAYQNPIPVEVEQTKVVVHITEQNLKSIFVDYTDAILSKLKNINQY